VESMAAEDSVVEAMAAEDSGSAAGGSGEATAGGLGIRTSE